MLSNKRKNMGLWEIGHLLLGNWLGISLPTAGGEWLLLHHLFCFLSSSSTYNSLLKQLICVCLSCLDPQVFLLLFFLSSFLVPLRVLSWRVSQWLCGAYLPTGVKPQQPYSVGLGYTSSEDSGSIIVSVHPNLPRVALLKRSVQMWIRQFVCASVKEKATNWWCRAQLSNLLVLAALFHS